MPSTCVNDQYVSSSMSAISAPLNVLRRNCSNESPLGPTVNSRLPVPIGGDAGPLTIICEPVVGAPHVPLTAVQPLAAAFPSVTTIVAALATPLNAMLATAAPTSAVANLLGIRTIWPLL